MKLLMRAPRESPEDKASPASGTSSVLRTWAMRETAQLRAYPRFRQTRQMAARRVPWGLGSVLGMGLPSGEELCSSALTGLTRAGISA